MIRLLDPRRINRRSLAIYAAAVALGAVLGWLVWANQVRGNQISALASALDAQRSQAQRSGQTPVAPPAGDILASPGIIKGERGAPGAPGRGLAALWCTSAGRWQASYTDGTLVTDAGACTGPPGIPGAAGLAGPTGSPGPPGPAGTDGKDGVNGTDGVDGKDGADGKPPAGWTWTDQLGRTYLCDRDASSPDSAPRYTCRPA